MDAIRLQEPRRRWLELADGQMSALDFGDPERPVDVVFAHANGFNAQTYRRALGPLSSALRILALDLRGHGASRLPTPERGHRSWRLFARDIGAVLDGLDGPPVVLAGHSMGATASLLAAAEPSAAARVRGLVLFEPVILPWAATLYARLPWGPAMLRRRLGLARQAAARRSTFDSREAAFAAYKGRGAFKTWPESVLADYVAGGFLSREDGKVELACPPAWEAANYAAQGHASYRALDRATAPIRILRAERGSTCRISGVAGRLRRHPNLRIDVVPDASHFLPMERPDLVREALLDAAG